MALAGGCQVKIVAGVVIVTGCSGPAGRAVPGTSPRGRTVPDTRPAPPRPAPGGAGAAFGAAAAAALAKCIESGVCNIPTPQPGSGGGPTTTTTPRSRDCSDWDDSDGLFRGMKGSGGSPELGPSGRTLGARPGTDVPVNASGMVQPGTGGMSVAPDSPMNLPLHRRPAECDGSGADPVWKIGKNSLGSDLRYRPDPSNPSGHGFVEPARPMTIQQYQQALHSTASFWVRMGL
jgi:hypothetical protein